MSSSDTSRTSSAPRRTKTSKPGIYFRENARGERTYEFTYRDSNGKQRWTGGFRTIKDAEAERSEVARRIRRGDNVVPIKKTLVEFAEDWLASETEIRPGTRARYEWAIRCHLAPYFGAIRVGEVDRGDVERIVAKMRKADYSAATIEAVLAPLSLVLDAAVEEGAAATNAVARLGKRKRPKADEREMRILQREEIPRLLAALPSDADRALIATLVFAGLRVSEAFGLTWGDVEIKREVDADGETIAGGTIRVRGQLDKTRKKVAPKTASAVRSVVMMPALAKTLAAHRLASAYSTDDDSVFVSSVGSPLSLDNFRKRVFVPAVAAAGLDRRGDPEPPDPRSPAHVRESRDRERGLRRLPLAADGALVAEGHDGGLRAPLRRARSRRADGRDVGGRVRKPVGNRDPRRGAVRRGGGVVERRRLAAARGGLLGVAVLGSSGSSGNVAPETA